MRDVGTSAVRAKVIEPVEGRTVVLTEERWDYIRSGHRDMARYERDVMETITHPDDHKLDIRPGRERYFGLNKGPSAWLRVVVEFVEEDGSVVTAFGQDNEP